MYKKGILLTLSLVTLASILFSTAFLTSFHENEAEQGVTELIILDNLYLKHMYLSNSIKRIFDLQAISIEFDNNYVVINISNDYIPVFQIDMQGFIDFVESMDDSIEFSDLSSKLDLIIDPYNITYSHSYSADKVTIQLNTNSLGINISMDIDDDNVTGPWTWNTLTPGDFPLTVYIKGHNGNYVDITNSIDLYMDSELEIDASLGLIVININSTKIEISNGAVKGFIETKILLNSTIDTSIIIPNAYTISSYNSELTGNVHVAEK
jgi:hypothetical protein